MPDPRLENTPLTLNEAYLDAVLRHSIDVRRLTLGEVKKVLSVLKIADKELSEKLRKSLAHMSGKPANFQTKRIKSLLTSIRAARTAVMKEVHTISKESLLNVAKFEEVREREILAAILPVEVQLASVDVATLRALVVSSPFASGAGQSRNLQQWFDELSEADQRRLIGAVQQGIAQGETVEQIMARVAGTRAGGYRDGVLALTRRNAEVIVRTAINHVSNAARESIFEQNADLIDGLRWVSTLDGRTSAICRSRDGKVAPVGDKPLPAGVARLVPPGARPPAHPNCRSVMVAIFNVDGVARTLGERPYVRDIRTQRTRQLDFREEAREQAGERWSGMSRTQRNTLVRSVRERWAADTVGRVPAEITYQEWLKRQPASFQDQVLGVTRGRLFRKGGLTLDHFVDRLGSELTLEQLAKRNPAAFVAVGIELEKQNP